MCNTETMLDKYCVIQMTNDNSKKKDVASTDTQNKDSEQDAIAPIYCGEYTIKILSLLVRKINIKYLCITLIYFFIDVDIPVIFIDKNRNSFSNNVQDKYCDITINSDNPKKKMILLQLTRRINILNKMLLLQATVVSILSKYFDC